MSDSFEGHYADWRKKRMAVLVAHYGQEWFAGKRVLELGCGHGHVGRELLALGAEVVFSEARTEHCETLRGLGLSPVQFDIEKDPWPFTGRFDLVVHWGVLYHVAPENFRKALECCSYTDRLCLESHVCASKDPTAVLPTNEEGFDQAINGVGCRPSAAAVEAVLGEHFNQVERIDSAALNSSTHVYAWEEDSFAPEFGGLRRFWFADQPR